MKRALSLTAALALVLSVVSGAMAAGHTETIVQFDPALGQLPEGVAVDKVGNVFASLSPLAQLVKVDPHTGEWEVFGQVDSFESGNGLLGLAVDAPGNVYGTVQDGIPVLDPGPANGVWRFDRRTGEATHIAGTEGFGFPNDLAFDKRGNLYVSDSFVGFDDEGTALGGIWRIDKMGNVEPWFVDTAIGGTAAFLPIPVGANGLEYRQGKLYVANTDRGQILSVEINPDGNLPGDVEVIVTADDVPFLAGGPDGLALDVHGNVYVAVIGASTVARVNADGSFDVLAMEADGIDWASSIAFGTARGDRHSLYAVNFAIGGLFGMPGPWGPGIVKIATDAKGMPLP